MLEGALDSRFDGIDKVTVLQMLKRGLEGDENLAPEQKPFFKESLNKLLETEIERKAMDKLKGKDFHNRY